MTNFFISKNLKNEESNLDIYRAVLQGKKATTLEDFYIHIAQQLDFPDYFGHNLDALDEMLNDLNWLEQNAVIVEFKNFDEFLEEENLDTKAMILSLIDQAADDQKMADDGTHLKVIFEETEGIEDFMEEMGFEFTKI